MFPPGHVVIHTDQYAGGCSSGKFHPNTSAINPAVALPGRVIKYKPDMA